MENIYYVELVDRDAHAIPGNQLFINSLPMETQHTTEIAVFGGGCFWCTEAIFKMLRGVVSVAPGYAGGTKENPTYDEISTGKTGHAEVIRIDFSPEKVSFQDLLAVFFAMHDPTTPNRQGNDVGPQYRSIVLYANEAQKKEAEEFITKLNATDGAPIATIVEPLKRFYEAEEYHRDYFAKNPGNPYCTLVINPKLEKAKKRFAELLRASEDRK